MPETSPKARELPLADSTDTRAASDAPNPSVSEENAPMLLLARFDNVLLNLIPGDERQLYFPSNGSELIDLASYSIRGWVSVAVTQLRYGDGEIVDFDACSLGDAPIPPPFKPVTPPSPTQVYSVGGEVSPARIFELSVELSKNRTSGDQVREKAYSEVRFRWLEKFSGGGSSRKWPIWRAFSLCKLNKIKYLRLDGGEWGIRTPGRTFGPTTV
jgi:hypothetical protein